MCASTAAVGEDLGFALGTANMGNQEVREDWEAGRRTLASMGRMVGGIEGSRIPFGIPRVDVINPVCNDQIFARNTAGAWLSGKLPKFQDCVVYLSTVGSIGWNINVVKK